MLGSLVDLLLLDHKTHPFPPSHQWDDVGKVRRTFFLHLIYTYIYTHLPVTHSARICALRALSNVLHAIAACHQCTR